MAWTEYLPDISLASVISVIAWLFVIMIVGAIVAILTYFYMKGKKFNKKLVIFEKVSGKYEPTLKDSAMILKFGRAGDFVFLTRKSKKYLTPPNIQTGRNTYWYAVLPNGEWLNIGIEDVGVKAKTLGVHFDVMDMRFARAGLQKILRERYEKPKFWEKYGALLVNISVIVILMVFLWLIVDKLLDVIGSVNTAIELANQVLGKVDGTLGSLDNVCSGGSGLVS